MGMTRRSRAAAWLCALMLGTTAAHAQGPADAPVSPQLHGDQFLYGSAEAAAISRQTWGALVAYVEGELRARPRHGVVLAPGSTLAAPRFLACGSKPPAAVFDIDETVLLNLGAEYDDLVSRSTTFSHDKWLRWERTGSNAVATTPGAPEALARLRRDGVTVIFNSNRDASTADETAAALRGAGLGPARHGDTLYLQGDDATGSAKDGRRARIAARFCVLAMGGDQLTDFSDLFRTEPHSVAERRADASLPGIAGLWGAGWFVMPNPVYGSALQGGAEDIFPAEKRWRDPETPRPAGD